jgi:hypothetical protein
MKPNTLKLSLVLALSLATLAACDKQGKKSEEAAAPDTTNVATATATAPAPAATTPTAAQPATTPAPAPAAGAVKEQVKAMKLACADDIKKFCATDGEKPGRCLKEHESDLSPGCNTARQALKAARKAQKADKDE